MRSSAPIFALGVVCLVVGSSLAQYQTAPAYSSGYKQQQRKMAPKPQLSMAAAGYGAERNQMQQDKQQDAYEMMMSNGGAAAGSGAAYGAQNKASVMMMRQQQQQQSSNSYGASNSAAMQQGYGDMQQEAGYGAKQAAKYQEPEYPPMPFAWGYDINDGYGTTQYHKENGDENGKRTGSYGYMDAYGVYRNVYYVADENGFRATVKTNEPGTANEAPADVDWTAEEPPATVFMGNPKSYSKSQASGNSYSSSQSSSASMDGQQYGSGDQSGSQYGSMNGNQQYSGMRLSGAAAGAGSARQTGYGMNKQQPMMMMMMNAMDKQQYGAAAADMGANYGAQRGGLARPKASSAGAYSSPDSMMGAGNKMQQYSANKNNRADSSEYSQDAPMPDFGAMMMGIASKVQRQEQQMMGADEAAQQYGAAGQEANIGQQYGSGTANMLNSNNNAQQQYAAAGQATGAAAEGPSTYASTRIQAASQARANSNYQMADAARQNAGSSSYGSSSSTMAPAMSAYAGNMMQQMPAGAMESYRKSATKTSQTGNQARRY